MKDRRSPASVGMTIHIPVRDASAQEKLSSRPKLFREVEGPALLSTGHRYTWPNRLQWRFSIYNALAHENPEQDLLRPFPHCSPLRCSSRYACFFRPRTQVRRPARRLPPRKQPHDRSANRRLKKMDGFFPLYWEARTGKLLLEIPSFDKDFLYLDQLPYGIGSNDLGLDRGQLGTEWLCTLCAVGTRCCCCSQTSPSALRHTDPAERAAVTAIFCGIGALRVQGRSGTGRWRRAAMCWWTPPISSFRIPTA